MKTDATKETLDLVSEIAKLINGRPLEIVLCAKMILLAQLVYKHKIPSDSIKGMLDEYISKNLEGKDDPRS